MPFLSSARSFQSLVSATLLSQPKSSVAPNAKLLQSRTRNSELLTTSISSPVTKRQIYPISCSASEDPPRHGRSAGITMSYGGSLTSPAASFGSRRSLHPFHPKRRSIQTTTSLGLRTLLRTKSPGILPGSNTPAGTVRALRSGLRVS